MTQGRFPTRSGRRRPQRLPLARSSSGRGPEYPLRQRKARSEASFPGTFLQVLLSLMGTAPPLRRELLLRAWLMAAALMLGIAFMTWRMVDLQVFQAPDLQKRAMAQQQAQLRPFIPRRSIVDRHSLVNQEAELLAVDRPVYTLWAHPTLFKNHRPDEIATKLAPILKITRESLWERLNTSQDTAIRLERWVPVEVADQIPALYIDGLELVSERQRIYPQKEMVAEVIGYVDLDHEGQAGLEYAHQQLLERTLKPVTIPRDGYGYPLASEVPEKLLQSGETVLQTTLDMRLQRAARTALKVQMDRFQALRGSVIVMAPQTGEILAMASEPTYDPNRYYDGYDPSLFRNWAVTDLYEPGSTFKPINIALALEAGAIESDTTVYDQGQIYVGGWPIQNYDYDQRGAHGWMLVGDVLKQSSNVGMVHLMDRLSPERYYEGLLSLGMNSLTGVDLPFEPASQLKSRRQFTTVPIEIATTSFGQGFSLTPLGLTSIHCVLANGGFKITPHVVKGLVETNSGETVWQPSRPEPIRVLSETTTRTVRTHMRDVVEYGTGRSAYLEGYEIGGKTGTAQKASPQGGYLKGKRITSFVGYFPALEPDYVILAVVDEPQGDDAYGSSVAAPIVRSVIEEIIAMNGVMPQTTTSLP